MKTEPLVLAVTGASGSRYAVRLLDVLTSAGRQVHLTLSPAAIQVFAKEMGRTLSLDSFTVKDFLGREADVSYHHYRDFSAGIASGSFLTGGMVVCPCSMGTVSAIAHGTSENLIARAADVHLKEKRPLVLVPRESPLGLVQLKNLVAAAEAGATILPAMPAFYTMPRSIDDMVDFIVGRICDHLKIPHSLFPRWGGDRVL